MSSTTEARLSILFASSEVVPFAKTGGLGDVVGALPRALAQLGQQTAVIMPLYRCARLGKTAIAATEHTFEIPMGERKVSGRLCRATLPDSDVPVYLIEQPDY
ncbi:MAG: glycogen/starch synthase, partial [Gemmataceae bacterium]